MYFNDQLVREIIRERSTRRFPTQRPTHPRTARLLRRLADRADGNR
ncbi:MAG: hypothetical protein AVDCRST_MAG21-1653 [uncultured Nocardioidaceae bacterium]|uniref:Uncharacterized protein n=1 Tax=uncultured Nocardioidaceae bacterium TaxID=253824 RepID=A0A6J4N6D7_9ACTN|nr:MAG: hypothetical protein AVDCRST_MAG21-1653 [uncultured Nocardioidaceae bacterium]